MTACLSDSKVQTIPVLPIEILVIVAEHLIGDHAFSTVANLNKVTRATHRETLPVLYETFFWHDFLKTQWSEDMTVLPEGFSHVK